MIRPEQPRDIEAVRRVTADAFRGLEYSIPPAEPGGDPGEAILVGLLREDEGWIPELSLVAEVDGELVGHVVATRGYVAESPALGLGPVSVCPDHQRTGIGSALVNAALGAADAMGEPLVVLLGDPKYYHRFGFRPASEFGVVAPEESWGEYFQARPLTAYDPAMTGRFRYAAPFDRF